LIPIAIGAAARFLPTAWRRAWAALALTVMAVSASVASVIGAGSLGAPSAWLLAAGALSLVARGGLWRLALNQGHPSPGGLQIGAVEARLAAVWALSGLFLAILLLLLLVVLLCCAYATASAGRGFDPASVSTWARAIDARGRLALTGATLLGVAGFVYALLRISLAEAASVAHARVEVLSTWRLSRGHVLTIFLGNLAVAAAPTTVLFVALANIPSHANVLLRSSACGLVVAGVWLPMNIGLMAYVFERSAARRSEP
jgi:hypothetical protein